MGSVRAAVAEHAHVCSTSRGSWTRVHIFTVLRAVPPLEHGICLTQPGGVSLPLNGGVANTQSSVARVPVYLPAPTSAMLQKLVALKAVVFPGTGSVVKT